MRRGVPAVRVWPMSDKIRGFRDKSIEAVQRGVFLGSLPANESRFRYPRAGLNAPAGTVVLFQFQARIIASAVLVRDEKSARRGGGGMLHFEAASFRIFKPIDVAQMRKAWPGFRGFGHVKQVLNPLGYAAFKRKLKGVERPAVTI